MIVIEAVIPPRCKRGHQYKDLDTIKLSGGFPDESGQVVWNL